MKSIKAFLRRHSTYSAIIGAIIVVAFGIVCIAVWKNIISSGIKSQRNNNNATVHTLTGTVTNKSGAIADAGEFLYVDDKLVRTASAGPSAGRAGFSVDTSHIEQGDRIEVHYINDSDGQATLDCASCSIKKLVAK